jgi:hypothetical protein
MLIYLKEAAESIARKEKNIYKSFFNSSKIHLCVTHQHRDFPTNSRARMNHCSPLRGL